VSEQTKSERILMQLDCLQRSYFDMDQWKKLNIITLGNMDFMRQLYIAESTLKVGLNNYIALEKSLDFVRISMWSVK